MQKCNPAYLKLLMRKLSPYLGIALTSGYDLSHSPILCGLVDIVPGSADFLRFL
ncbi:hypothetical protein A628_01305 [Salmonella enterica subsp. enterica serovar Cubana str. 76814]|uniref:Uncharacterized protein n=1 Tax=Salmonella enterica subsp. enterica serovar Cubana str. 76814 TaxID=1192560 RepID=V7ITP0_SALET|nr:hypothetical protein LTSEHVI_4484 [Salmonella enterica subsp. enterica serovar Hvittingfoss str. A4-620]ETA88646.1 hypothetical protein A628_01305 [Salmonella enterica subsp. enterica serovar Cubana str. 76814]